MQIEILNAVEISISVAGGEIEGELYNTTPYFTRIQPVVIFVDVPFNANVEALGRRGSTE